MTVALPSRPIVGAAPASRPVRVAHLVPRFCLGGMEQGIAKIVNAFDRGRIASFVCSLEATTPPRPVVHADVPVYELSRRPGNDPRLILRLAKWLSQISADVVHTHAWGTLVEGYLAGRLARVPVFVHGEHGTMDVRPRNLLVQRWVWGRADRVLSVSSRLADSMATTVGFPRDRITTLHNGADFARFGRVSRAEARLAVGVTPGDFVIGTVGRLVPVKDQATLLTVVAELARRSLPVKGVIVGDGPLRAELERQAHERGVQGRVIFLGHRDDVERIFPSFDVYVQTSVSEGLPNTVMEAMASGLPVVATDVGGTSELVEHGVSGILVEPGSSRGLVRAVETLARDAAMRRRMAECGGMRAVRDFSLDAMVRSYEALYLDLVKTPSGRRGL